MLSIGKIGPGQGLGRAEYYLEVTARGAEDYYLGRGEAPGVWLGRGSGELGLGGEVDDKGFVDVITRGRHPSGEQLYERRGRTVQAFDATFSAPKSVSLLFGLGDDDIRAAATAAHDAAVVQGLAYLEQHAAYARRGAGGAERVEGDGFVAAAFRHRVSRAGDPQLHTHVVIANMVEGPDGTWRTIDGRGLYAEAKTAGMIYQAALRRELIQQLGVAWEVPRNGMSEVRGFARSHLEAFSKRRQEILEAAREAGSFSDAQLEVITLQTRQPKQTDEARSEPGLERQRDYGVDPTGLYDRWRSEAAELGLDVERLRETTGRSQWVPPTGEQLADLAARLEGPEGLTRAASTFQRRDVVQAFANGLEVGADRRAVERLADAFLAGDDIVRVAETSVPAPARGDAIVTRDGRVVAIDPDERRYSTTEMLATEHAVIDRAVGRTGAGVARLDPARVDDFVAQLGSVKADQAQLLRQVATSGNGVDVVQALAGTGKTWALGRLSELYKQEGYRVIGLTSARTAVAEMAAEGITADTIARFLADQGNTPGGASLGERTVVMVDEAGMVSTRDWAPLLEHAGSAKVIMVGDVGQLPEIDAGGVLRGVQRRLGAVELTDVVRQSDPDEIAALAKLHAGAAGEALQFWRDRGQVTVFERADDAKAKLVDDWWAAHTGVNPETGQQWATMVFAPRREQADELNQRMRARMQAEGHLSADALFVPGPGGQERPFAVGDRIRPTRNWNAKGITNNSYGTVVGIDVDAGELLYQPDRSRALPVRLPASYLAEGLVDYGYARTAHKAQGGTTDKAFFLGDASVYREMSYVAMSRHRAEVALYVTGVVPLVELDTPGREPADVVDELVRSMAKSRGKELALDARPDRLSTAELAAERRQLAAALELIPNDQTKLLAQVRSQHDEISAKRRDVIEQLRRVGEPRQGEPAAATAQRAQLLDSYDQLTGRHSELVRRIEAAEELQTERERLIVEYEPEIDRYQAVASQLDTELRYAVRADEATEPAYVSDLIGGVPEGTTGRDIWRRGATAIEQYRLDWGINDNATALGPRPRRDGPQQRDYDRTGEIVTECHRDLVRNHGAHLGALRQRRLSHTIVSTPGRPPGPSAVKPGIGRELGA